MTVTVRCRWCKARGDTVFCLITSAPKRAARSGQPAKDHEISEAVGPSLLPADHAGRRSGAIGANGVSVLVVLIVRAISGIGGLVVIVAVAAVIAVVITISAVSAYAKSADEVSVAMPTAMRGMSGNCAGRHCREAAANGVTLESATVDCADASAPESTGVGAMECTDAATTEGSCAAAVETTTTAEATTDVATAATTDVAATAAAAMAAKGHRTGRHRCCKGNGHRTCDQLFPHYNLLHEPPTKYRPDNRKRGQLVASRSPQTCTTIRYE
jgi:hypothetical protein